MAEYPGIPLPSSISAPSYIDPIHTFSVDQGYSLRRSKHSRARKRYILDYLGKRTDEMRVIREFLLAVRLSALAFSFIHSTAIETPFVITGTPTLLNFPDGHGMVTGEWLAISNAASPELNNARWQVTRLSREALTLNGSTAVAGGTCNAQVYLPNAIAVFSQDTWESPVKLTGPEVARRGYWNFQVTIEEIF